MATRTRAIRAARILLALGCLSLLYLGTTPWLARADYQGPDDTMSQAFGPISGGMNYSASVSGDDQDWFYYYVPTAGTTLHWTVSNKNAITNCNPNGIYYCSLYATLIGPDGKQLGGDNSSAGTYGVAPGTTQTVDWKYDQPGRYYVAVVGDGDSLTYQFNVTPASGLSSSPPSGASDGGAGGGPTTISARSLHLKAARRARNVVVTLTSPSSGGRVTGKLTMKDGTSAGRKTRRNLPSGRVTFAIRLSSRAWSALKSRRHLALKLSITLSLPDGRVGRVSRSVALSYP
jgi:hypothetical protein